MVTLFDMIRERVVSGNYLVTQHATERLDERGILEWQVVDGISAGGCSQNDLTRSPTRRLK